MAKGYSSDTIVTEAVAENATSPTPTAGNVLWSSTTNALMKANGTKWMSLKRGVVLKMCSADFTPTATGLDYGGLALVPYDPNSPSRVSIAWTVTDIFFRMETQASTTSSVQIARSTGTGNFTNAGYLNTTAYAIASAHNEPTAALSLAVTTVNSGDKLCPSWVALGTGGAGYSLWVVLCES